MLASCQTQILLYAHAVPQAGRPSAQPLEIAV